jgi:demethylmenaquinone methyltransferase/2-methoxy-6-polyprenyl-1,4-benzoquinol methylase
VLDVGAGTADLAIEMAAVADAVVALDFCPEMMSRGKAKVTKKGLERKVNFILGDAEELPFASDSFDCVVSGFAMRNMSSIIQGLAEMRRVVKPGGLVVSLELIMPSALVVRTFHQLYLWGIIPVLGRVVTHDSAAYIYLPKSISDFPRAEEVKAIMERVGFHKVNYKLLNLGTVAIHSGVK